MIVRKFGKGSLLRSTVLAGFAATAFAASPALAQDADEEDVAETEEDQQVAGQPTDRVIITGSRIRRDEFTSASPIQVVNAEVATLEGLVDTGELVQSTSVAAGSVQLNNQFAGFVVEGGTGINSISLRGLGAQRSLVLLNGRRPGPAGVRGQVGSFDLNVIPTVILTRAEILKDGAGSVYGSDAVAGVVNLITVSSMDEPIISAQYNAPFEGGGETFEVSGAYGINLDRGNIVLAAQYQSREDLSVGDRDYLECQQDLVSDADGNIIDREDRSILAGTDLAGCSNIYFNTYIDAIFGTRYIPSPDGVTVGPVAGYRPRGNAPYGPGGTGQAFYEDVLNDERYASTDAINKQERISLYAQSNFTIFNDVDWNVEGLFTRRETETDTWRQFFPLMGGATALFPGFSYPGNPGFVTPTASGIAQPVMIFPGSTPDVTVDYYSLATGFEGGFTPSFGFLSDWTWSLDAIYSRSEGEYESQQIRASTSGDVRFDPDGPDLDYFDPAMLSGDRLDELVDAVGVVTVGETVYEQTTVTGFVTGDLFDLPAGPVGAVVGAEYRTFSIDDQPDELSINGDLWGSSSALVTAGDDTVMEAFGELEIPIVAGRPFFEELTFNGSARWFDYDSVGNDSVWKAGLNWQVHPVLRLRATQGTSFRAPALYELFLGDQTSFLSQLNIDPCIEWGDSSNENIRANCAAEGIPPTFGGGPSSATIVSGGGAGVLEPETSDAKTYGLILTPTALNLSVALDYFEIEVNDQIGQLGGGAIVGSCYGAENFPNNFCTLFDRNPDTGGTDAFAITEVRDSFININRQVTEGLDLTVRYDHEFDFGTLIVESQSTWTFEDVVNLFDPSLESGFDVDDFNGTIGNPDFVSNVDIRFSRGDWTFSWFTDFISRTSEADFVNEEFTYFNFPNARRIIDAEPVFYHDASVRYERPTWSILAGVSNIFDEHPPVVSTGTATRRGNVPLNGTQYDLRGRTGFVRVTKTF